jgi:ankyrin repeat protein
MAGVCALAAPDGAGLIEAARNQDTPALRSLLKQKVEVNATDAEGMTALLWSAHRNDVEAVRLLLGAGANARAASRLGATPLSEAAGNGNGEMIEELLKAGANPNTTVGEGETALMTASRTGSVAGVRALVARGANVHAKESYRGQTALMFAVGENHAEVARLLIAAGAGVNERSRVYDFNFRKVAAGGTQAVYYKGGLTPLLLAARQGAIESARVLLEAGAELEAREPEFGLTPLVEAIYNDHYDFAAFLVEKGANVNDGALYTAVEMRNLEYFGNRPRKPVTDKLDELAFMKFLLARGADPNAAIQTKLPQRQAQGGVVVPDGATPFYRAARSADVVTMRLLLEHGANPNLPNQDGTTPLIAAATGQGARFAGGEERPEAEFVEAIRLCLEMGAGVNAVNDRGDTALHAAAQRGAGKIVEFLAAHGARLDAKNKAGRTPLDLAMGVGGVANTGGSAQAGTAALLRRLMESGSGKAQ